MGSCLSSSAAGVAPEVLTVIETAVQAAVQAAVHTAVVELLADLHLSINAGRVLGGPIAMEPAKLG